MIVITLDSSILEYQIAQARSLLSEVGELPLEVVERLLCLLDSTLEFTGIELQPALGASELRYRAQLPNSFLEFVRTLPASDRDARTAVR